MRDPFIYNVISLVTLIGGSLLVALFSREPWRKQTFGRAFMALAVAVTLFALASSMRLWLGDHYWGRQAVRLTANLFAAGAVWSALWALIKIRRALPDVPRRRASDMP